MIAQVIRYFRFEKTTMSDGGTPSNTYDVLLPVRFTESNESYAGYDLAPWTIKYTVNADVDLTPDTFVITIDKNFFRNPTNDASYNISGLTDTNNTFQINVNHVIVISPPIGIETATAYMFEDNGVHGTVFGKVKTFVENTDTTEITCESFLKYINEKTFGQTYKMKDIDDTINQTQVYYAYSDDTKAQPYFAPADTGTIDNSSGRYRISAATEKSSMITYVPLYPREMYHLTNGVTSAYLTKDGYSAQKIAWRLLQEVGWCREEFRSDILKYNGITPIESGAEYDKTVFLNPYQTFTLSNSQDFNENTMVSVQTSGTTMTVQFKSFDTDGLRYDYLSNPVEAYNTDYEQTYYDSFDPSTQSLLYDLKTLAESDGMFISLSYAPRIENSQIVWDYTVYEGSGDTAQNLNRWSIYAGFRPKVMIRRNPVDKADDPEGILKYGNFTEDPDTSSTARALIKSIAWTKNSTDMINQMLVKYGTNADNDTDFITLPFDVITGTAFVLNLNGTAPTSLTISISLELGPTITPDTFTIHGSYNSGTYAEAVVADLVSLNTSTIIEMQAYNGALFLYVDENSEFYDAIHNYWADSDNPVDCFSYSIVYDTTTDSGFEASKEYVTESEGFQMAVDSILEFGVHSVSLSFPELKSLKDVMSVADKLFRKFSPPKYVCETSCNDVDDGVLPLFAKYEIIDESNTKQIVNHEDSIINFTISGTSSIATTLTVMLPQEDSSALMSFPVSITSGRTSTQIAASIETAFNALHRDIPTLTRVNNVLTFTYTNGANILNTTSFYSAKVITADGAISSTKTCTLPALYTQVTYDETLALMKYTATSTSLSTSYTFGYPTETIWNVLNSMQMWIGDVNKAA